MADDLDRYSDEPLTPLENKKLRKIVQDQERMDWLWATGRIWVGWVLATVAAFYVMKEKIAQAIKAIMS